MCVLGRGGRGAGGGVVCLLREDEKKRVSGVAHSVFTRTPAKSLLLRSAGEGGGELGGCQCGGKWCGSAVNTEGRGGERDNGVD